MALANMLIGYITGRSARRFTKATKAPKEVQERLLLDIVRANENTEYGRRYGFASIRSIAEYQRRVPVVTYEDIKEDMLRVVAGETNILTAENPLMFAQTSGTTGDPKYIPVTPTCRGRNHSDQMRTWTYRAREDHPGLFNGKVVSLVSPAVEGYTPGGLPYGSTSGHIYKNMPTVIRGTYSLPYEVFEIADYGAKYYTIMRLAMEDTVTFLATANPSSVIKMCEKADEFGEEIIRDIHDGTLSQQMEVAAEIRHCVRKRLRPNPALARRLEKMRSMRDGRLLPADYWPSLLLIGCWKGGSVGHYLARFPDWFDPDGRRSVPVRDMGYLSSEARGSIPLSDEGSRGVLTVATNFMEFVAVDELEAARDTPEAWRFLTIDEIADGEEYYIFFTTTAGLYRYDINDVIRVDGRFNNTPQIVFVRKGRGMTNITGEKVSVNQVITAFQRAAETTGLTIDHFKAEADQGHSRYLFRVEFSRKTDADQQRSLLLALDDQLKRVNIEYLAKRDSGRLAMPILHVMREGWYERNRKRQVDEGMRAFQAKTQLLSRELLATQLVVPELEAVVECEDPGAGKTVDSAAEHRHG